MVSYDLRVEKQQIFGAEKIAIAADSNKTVELRFYFDANWRIFDAKAAIFRTAENKYYIIEIKSSSVTVPWEVLTVDRDFELSVIGYDESTALTAGKVTVRVVSSLLPEDCKTFSPTETLFDRIRQDSVDEAYKKYRGEIESLKRSYDEKILSLGLQINEANENTKNVEKAKNEEIAEIQRENESTVSGLNSRISELNGELDEAKVKAEKWDLVDAAMSDKIRSNNPLWNGGSKEYKLPFFNTKSTKVWTSTSFDNYVSELGLDLTQATSADQLFMGKEGLKKIRLASTGNLTSTVLMFNECPSLRDVELGNLEKCTNVKQMFLSASSLEKVKLGTNGHIRNFNGMFSGCVALREIDATLNFSAAEDVADMFLGCGSLEKVSFEPDSIAVDIDLGVCKALSKESMRSLFNGLHNASSCNVTVSKYAYDNNFPTVDERDSVESDINEKGWELTLV